MKTVWSLLACAFWFGVVAAAAQDEAKVAVAIRYLQIQGTSHAHLYLYRPDGTLIRQLTADNAGQDIDPVFSPDGQQIVFTRQDKSGRKLFLVRADGRAAARQLATAPAWYEENARRAAVFNYPPFVPVSGDQPEELRISHNATPGELRFPAPDGTLELLLRDTDRTDSIAGYYRKIAYLRDTGSAVETEVASLPVVALRPDETESENDYDGLLVRGDGSPFLFHPPLRVAFFRQHRGSTDGVGFFALDCNERRMVELVPNGGAIVPLPNEPAFLTETAERYLPLGDGKRTVNCSYLDRWDAALKRTRYARTKPAIFYGASIYRPSHQPAVVTIRKDAED